LLQCLVGDGVELLCCIFGGDGVEHLGDEEFHFLVFFGTLVFVFLDEVSFGEVGYLFEAFLLDLSHFLGIWGTFYLTVNLIGVFEHLVCGGAFYGVFYGTA
jgi:hypothetical protein